MFRPRCNKNILQTVKKKCFQNHPLYQPSISAFHCTSEKNDVYEIKGEDDFKERVMRSSVPVIVNFHADWCEPCHLLKPLLENIVKENDGKIHLAEILVDNHASLLQTFEVTAVPAVLAIHRGSVKDKFIGLVSDQQIKTFIEKLLNENIAR